MHGGSLLFEILTLNVCCNSRLPVLTVLLGHLLLLRHRLLCVGLPGTLILLAVEELVADAEVLLHRVDDVREPIIVTIYLHHARDERVDSVVVANDLDVADDAERGHLAPGILREDLVVVTLDVQVRDRVAGADLDLAVVASQVHGIGRLCQSHAHAVVGDVDRIVRGRVLRLLLSATTASHVVMHARALRLLALEVHVACWHSCLVESRPELLREICKD